MRLAIDLLCRALVMISISYLVGLSLHGTLRANPLVSYSSSESSAAQTGKDSPGKSKTIVNMDLALLKILPTTTVTLTAPKVSVALGETATIQMGANTSDGRSAETECRISIYPYQIGPGGIDFQVEWKMRFGGKEHSAANRVRIRNLEKAVVELFEVEGEQAKIVLQIVPLIETAPLLEAYPQPLHELHMKGAMLLLDNRRIFGGPGGMTGSVTCTEEGALCVEILTKQFGRFRLFLRPAKKAEVTGFVKDNVIQVSYKEHRFELVSRDNFLDGGPWAVWVQHDPEIFTYSSQRSDGQTPVGPDWSREEASVSLIAGISPME